MKYEVMFYVGMSLTIVFLIITIIAFFKCNVVEIIYDLLGIKRNTKLKKTKKSKVDNEKVNVKKMDSIQIRSKAAIEEKEVTREYEMEESPEVEKTSLFQEYVGKIEECEYTVSCKDENVSFEKNIHLQNNNGSAAFLNEEDTGILNEEETGILTEEDTGILTEEETGILNEEDTGILNEEETGILNEEETGILNEEETGILNEEETGILNEEETGILNEEETGILDESEVLVSQEFEDGFSDVFTKEIDITIIHSDKVI